MTSRTLFAALLSTVALSVNAQTYKLAIEYSGSSFFDRWTFQNGIDTNTTGNVLFQSREQAQQLGLTTVNSAGNVIIKVDNKTSGANDPTFGRPSVKILSNDTVKPGSLLIMDAVHMPYGCSVWPAYWTQGSNWPDDGEIDIVENVNLATNNQYALHTLQGCQHSPAGSVQETGKLQNPDCFNQTNGNEGCLVQDTSSNSYGAGFAQNGGGAFATLWDDQGIRIWFFPRNSIPSDVESTSPNPSGWGTPTAFYSSNSCDFNKFFGSQTIIFDITVCGNFAGSASVFNAGNKCTGNCLDLVQTPTNYDTAYFEIKFLRLFTNGSSSANPSASGSGSSPSGTSGVSASNAATDIKSLLPLFGTALLTVGAAIFTFF